MRRLVKKILDNEITRRSFITKVAALGVSLSSAKSLLETVSPVSAAEETPDTPLRQVTGNVSDLILESLSEPDTKYIFHGCGGGTFRFFDSIVARPNVKNILATNEGQCVAMAEGYHMISGNLGVALIPKQGLQNAGGNIFNALADRSSLLILTPREDSKFSERQGDMDNDGDLDSYIANADQTNRLIRNDLNETGRYFLPDKHYIT